MKTKFTFHLPTNRYAQLLELSCYKGLSLDKLILELCDNAITDFRMQHRMAHEHYTASKYDEAIYHDTY